MCWRLAASVTLGQRGGDTAASKTHPRQRCRDRSRCHSTASAGATQGEQGLGFPVRAGSCKGQGSRCLCCNEMGSIQPAGRPHPAVLPQDECGSGLAQQGRGCRAGAGWGRVRGGDPASSWGEQKAERIPLPPVTLQDPGREPSPPGVLLHPHGCAHPADIAALTQIVPTQTAQKQPRRRRAERIPAEP